jgi:hypothetical protein
VLTSGNFPIRYPSIDDAQRIGRTDDDQHRDQLTKTTRDEFDLINAKASWIAPRPKGSSAGATTACRSTWNLAACHANGNPMDFERDADDADDANFTQGDYCGIIRSPRPHRPAKVDADFFSPRNASRACICEGGLSDDPLPRHLRHPALHRRRTVRRARDRSGAVRPHPRGNDHRRGLQQRQAGTGERVADHRRHRFEEAKLHGGAAPIKISEPFEYLGETWRDCTYVAHPHTVAMLRARVLAKARTSDDVNLWRAIQNADERKLVEAHDALKDQLVGSLKQSQMEGAL